MSTSTAAPHSSGTLVGIECTQCKTRVFPPVDICSKCLSQELDPVELPRAGVVYASSVIHVGPKTRAVPYGVGYVDLEGDVRVFVHFDAEHKLVPGDEVSLLIDDEGVPAAERKGGS